MSRLFVRPSQVTERLREAHVILKAKIAGFPDVKVLSVFGGQIQDEVADSDANLPEATTLYVASGLSAGSLATDAGAGITEITHGVSIGLIIGTRDEHAQYADELQTLIKEFVILSLHGWHWNGNQTPLYYSNESLFKVKGHSVMFRTYDFSHNVDVSYEDIDDAFDLWDSLDDFTLLKDTTNADNQQGDTATVLHEVELDGPA